VDKTLQAEVGRVMAQEHAKPARPVTADASPGYDARERNRDVMTPLQGEQTGPVITRAITGQIADSQPIDPDANRIGVVWMLVFRGEYRSDFNADPFTARLRPR
jgi:hypothetical protein